MIYQVRATTALEEDPGSILASMHATHNHLCLIQVSETATLCSDLCGYCIHVVHIHADKTLRHIKMMLMSEALFLTV